MASWRDSSRWDKSCHDDSENGNGDDWWDGGVTESETHCVSRWASDTYEETNVTRSHWKDWSGQAPSGHVRGHGRFASHEPYQRRLPQAMPPMFQNCAPKTPPAPMAATHPPPNQLPIKPPLQKLRSTPKAAVAAPINPNPDVEPMDAFAKMNGDQIQQIVNVVLARTNNLPGCGQAATANPPEFRSA